MQNINERKYFVKSFWPSFDIIILVKVYRKSYQTKETYQQQISLCFYIVAEVKSVSLDLLSLDQNRKYAVLPSLAILVCCNTEIVSHSVSQSVSNVECLSLSSQLLTATQTHCIVLIS